MINIFGRSGTIVTKKALIWLAVILVLITLALSGALLVKAQRYGGDRDAIEDCLERNGLVGRDGDCVGVWVDD